jgi:hypothetical protein
MAYKNWLSATVGLTALADDSTAIGLWIEDIRQAMLDIGLVQTADAGQFDQSGFAYTPPSYSGERYAEFTYLLFAFSDALQSAAPLFVRLGIGAQTSAENSSVPAVQISVGSASDGNGTITGDLVQSRRLSGPDSMNTGYSVSSQSFACFNPESGFLGIVYASGTHNAYYDDPVAYGQNRCLIGAFIERIPALSGEPTAAGFTLWSCNEDSSQYSSYSIDAQMEMVAVMESVTRKFSPENKTYQTPRPSVCLGATELLASADIPRTFINPFFHNTPEPVRSNGLGSMLLDPAGRGQGLTVAMYGTPRNYVALGWVDALKSFASPVCVPLVLME